MDGRMNGQMDRWKDEQVNGRMGRSRQSLCVRRCVQCRDVHVNISCQQVWKGPFSGAFRAGTGGDRNVAMGLVWSPGGGAWPGGAGRASPDVPRPRGLCSVSGPGPADFSPCARPLPRGWVPAVTVRLLTVLLSHQAQLIHDRNTISHSAMAARTQAPSTLDKVQMTWTKEKLVAEKHRNKDASVSGFRDLFSLKP